MDKTNQPFHPIQLSVNAFDNIAKLKLGLLALSTDVNSEQDVSQMLPNDVHLFTSRLANSNPVTIENLARMSNTIADSIDLLVPELPLDVLMYACTSGTIAIGEDKLTQIVQSKRPGIAVTNPVSAMLAALKTLNAKDISVLNPYSLDVNKMLIAYFETKGLKVHRNSYFNLDNDVEMTKITPETILKQAIDCVDSRSKALFISCTALRAASVVNEIEAKLGIPVITSNTAMVWHAINLAYHAKSKAVPNQSSSAELTETLKQVSHFGELFNHCNAA